jgi:hypothetical protein
MDKQNTLSKKIGESQSPEGVASRKKQHVDSDHVDPRAGSQVFNQIMEDIFEDE